MAGKRFGHAQNVVQLTQEVCLTFASAQFHDLRNRPLGPLLFQELVQVGVLVVGIDYSLPSRIRRVTTFITSLS